MELKRRKHRTDGLRTGFTLVELLVVITIIGMLMALLMPAVSAAREQARRATCINNQENIAKAMLAFQSEHSIYPGWRNAVTIPGSATATVSWLTMLLPNLDRNDLWKIVKTSGQTAFTTSVSPNALTFLTICSCPSDPPPSQQGVGTSAYVANGLVLRDEYLYSLYKASPTNATYLTYTALAPQTQEYISGNDGTTYTLMLGENTQAPPSAAATAGATAKMHNWYDVSVATSNTANGLNPQLIQQTFGFPITNANAPNAASPPYSTALITFATAYGSQTPHYNGNTMLSNINSSHGGGAVVVFFDGHSKFLKDDCGVNTATNTKSSQTVFQILVTPEGSKNSTEPPIDESQY